MALQNRVTPFGEIVATLERGTLLGNRGVLHDDHKRIVRTSQVRRWICCVLSFKGIRRTIMSPRSYTELFFLDEATALAAGHRPCFECRRPAALAFQRAWEIAFGAHATADAMDLVLAADRARTYSTEDRLPDGAFVAEGGAAWLIHGGRRLLWTPGGYARVEPLREGPALVLTPRATVEVLRAGYAASVHPSVGCHDEGAGASSRAPKGGFR